MTAEGLTTSSLPAILRERAQIQPNDIYLQDAISGSSWTYRDIYNASLRWGGAFQRVGVRHGDTVLTMMSSRIEFFFSWLGMSWLGGIEVPANIEYKGDMLRHVANNSGARLALVDDTLLDRVLSVYDELDHLRAIVVLGELDDGLKDKYETLTLMTLDEFLRNAAPLDSPSAPELYDIVSVVYTSGTTGPSKGVLQSWNQLRRNAYYSFPIERFESTDAFYFTTPTFHQGGKIVPYTVAMKGGKFVFREKFSATEFWSDVNTLGITFSILVGAMSTFLVNQAETDNDAQNPLKILQMIPVRPDVDEFKKRFGVDVITAYGMTEVSCAFVSTSYVITNVNAASCGKPVPGCRVRIVDEWDYDVGAGEVGELVVQCDEPWGHNQGYLNMPEETVRAWRNGWIHTGDGFRCDEDGYYYFVDRIKDCIRRRGENISSTEVEKLVLGHPAIQLVAAVAVPSEYGEDEVKVCIVLRDGEELSPEALIDYLIPVMPRFMIPRYVEFVDSLPQTANAKTKKAELRKNAINENTWDREKAGIELPR